MRGFCHLLAVLVVFAALAPTLSMSTPASAGQLPQAPSPSPAPVSLGPVRFVSTGAGSKITVDATFPPNPSACQANQPQNLQAAYPGTLEVGRRPDGHLYLITELTFPQYLKGIAEVPGSWPQQALEAQVVAARTYAIAHMNTGGAQARELNYNLCSTDACQVYRGLAIQDGVYGENWAKAVDDTAGQILEYGGKPIDAFYFSTSNGHTYSAADVFGGSGVPYLQPVSESDDTASPTSSWSVRMPLTDLAEILRLSGSWGSEAIDSVALQGDTVKVAGGGKSTTMALSSFRNRLNNQGNCLTPKRYPTAASGGGNLPQVVPSVWMTLRQDGSAIVMAGRGWGHGVGMVQWGAKGKADRGLDYRQILSYYYGGLTPVQVAEPGSIRVLLATGVQQVTVAPSGPVHVVGGPSEAPLKAPGSPGVAATVTITGGPAMTIAPAAQSAIAPGLALSGVTVTATATPGKPAGFSFNLNRAANVGISYQQAGVTATGSVAPVPLPSGDQTLPWDPIAAGLPPGTYDAALVADDGVSRVVSPSFQITVATTAPTPTPTPSPAAAPRSRGVKTKVPAWLPVGVGAVLLVVLLGAGAGLAVKRRRPPPGPPGPPNFAPKQP
jgi:stage II sporulation protein D